MKFCWRITKHDPKYQNDYRAYMKDEWCIYSEIGKTFNNVRFDFNEYERIERLYIESIKLFMECHRINELQIDALEKNKPLVNDLHNNTNIIKLFEDAKKSNWVRNTDLPDFCKLILRDKLWCKLRYPRKMFVHFGWDFYMYIGSSIACTQTMAEIKKNGLFTEPFKSPYE